MLRLSKKIEYGLLAVQFIAAHAEEIVPAKDIAGHYGISFELLAKVLRALAKSGLLKSHQGIQGGYSMARPASIVTVADVIGIIEGKQNIVECASYAKNCDCVAFDVCTIKTPMQLLQERIDQAFRSMTIAEMLRPTLQHIA